MDWKAELLKTVLPLVLTGLGIVGALALAKLRTWADEKAKESKLARALSTLPHLAEAVWADVYVELKEEIAADAADGVISPEELAQLKTDAVESLKKAMAKHGLGALKEAFGPLLDLVLGRAVEAAAQAAASPK